jgi:hypothetical protein
VHYKSTYVRDRELGGGGGREGPTCPAEQHVHTENELSHREYACAYVPQGFMVPLLHPVVTSCNLV